MCFKLLPSPNPLPPRQMLLRIKLYFSFFFWIYISSLAWRQVTVCSAFSCYFVFVIATVFHTFCASVTLDLRYCVQSPSKQNPFHSGLWNLNVEQTCWLWVLKLLRWRTKLILCGYTGELYLTQSSTLNHISIWEELYTRTLICFFQHSLIWQHMEQWLSQHFQN